MRILGIAGPSGTGKSFLAQAVLEAGFAETAAQISLDQYYHDCSHLPPTERAAMNFDEPGAVDHQLLLHQLIQLRQGQAIMRPCYDFDTHTRLDGCERIAPVELLIVEGLFVLYWAELRHALTMSVFVEAPDALCLQRRLARDVLERGRSADSVRWQYQTTVRSMAERYVLPTRRFADLVVSGDAPIADSVNRIRMHFLAMRGNEESA